MHYNRILTIRLFLIFIFICFSLKIFSYSEPKVTLGIDRLLNEASFQKLLKGKRVGLVTNHTAINSQFASTISLLKANSLECKLVALFAPEHGITGLAHAAKSVENSIDEDGIPIYSLHGATRRPTPHMLKGIDVIIFDIQDIGVRAYTYISTLFYVMEESAKQNIKVIVTDRPNPMGGTTVDGLLLDPKWRSFIGYVNVTYCHGMTVGELASLFNQENQINCDLTVVPMQGWMRSMSFNETGLAWIPTSPQIPEADTPYFAATTGFLGEFQIVNIGIGYTLPFKVVAAPWIDANRFAKELNAQRFPGVHFLPIHYRPFFGSFATHDCHGIQIVITDKKLFLPVETQYLLMGILKSLYPEQFKKAMEVNLSNKELFCKANGTEEVYQILNKEKYAVYTLRKMCQEARKTFLPIRKKYLLY
ncbi:MAG: DUF1343 domain-containing protein [Chlamydiales bacterium]|nr:DUF1343 domain-containing protein [Chlamydiales bacterium]